MKLLRNPMDPVSFYTHFIGACLAVLGLFIMAFTGLFNDFSTIDCIGLSVFCLSLIGLYVASSSYHYFGGKENIKVILRKLDHSMIYVLIVGTYTPVVLKCMEAPHSYYFLGILWAVALAGVILNIIWINAPRFFSTLIYLILGWAVLFDFSSFSALPSTVFLLIALGGISYSIGAVIYIIKKPNISIDFGFHEIFHLFVMLGSLFHYIAIFLLYMG